MIVRIIALVLIVLCSLALGFVPGSFESRLRPHGSFLTLSTIVDDVGKKLYDAAYAGNVEKLKTVLTECKGC